MDNSNAGMGMSGALGDPKEAGTALLKQGRFSEAAAVLREAVALDPNDESAWRLLGGALASAGDSDAAIQAFQNAVRIMPMAARSHYNLGLALQSAGRLSEARSSFERAVSLDPGHDAARARLGEVAQQLGQTRTAPAPSVPAEGHTNIGGGDASGLASLSSPNYQAQSQQQTAPASGHTNIGGGNSTGLLSIGAHREAPAAGGGHSNIGGGSTTGLSSVGTGAALPQDTGHTNIGGGNTGMLGGVAAGASPILRQPPPSAGPSSPPPSATPSAFGANAAGAYGASPGYAPPPVLGQNYSQQMLNTSGMQGDVPPEVAKKFNWGAFWFGWIWLFNMKATTWGWAMLVGIIVVNSISRGIKEPAVSGIISIAEFGLYIYLGIIGNSLAWRNRVFDSVEDFHRCQRIWAYWALGMFGLVVVLLIFAMVILGAAMMAMFSGGRSLPTH